MVVVNYQNRALWQEANDFKTRFIKKEKIEAYNQCSLGLVVQFIWTGFQ